MPKYNRVLLKLSGEALLGENDYGIDTNRLNAYVDDIIDILRLDVKVGIVIGGGNIFRGMQGTGQGIDRVKGDYMGMLATVINGIALQSAFEQKGYQADHLTAIAMEPIGKRYTKHAAIEALNRSGLVIFTFGTGNPYFTTDTAASLRALEMEAELVLKGTRVDGIYNADPELDSNATKYHSISFKEVMDQGLKVMDLTAFAMCRDNNLPILVFDMNTKGNLEKVIKGENIGTLVSK